MKGNLELETTRQMGNCINFMRRHEICRVWDVSLSHYPTPESFLPPNETVFREVRNHSVTSKSNRINLQFNSPPVVFKNTANLNFKKLAAKNSRF